MRLGGLGGCLVLFVIVEEFVVRAEGIDYVVRVHSFFFEGVINVRVGGFAALSVQS